MHSNCIAFSFIWIFSLMWLHKKRCNTNIRFHHFMTASERWDYWIPSWNIIKKRWYESVTNFCENFTKFRICHNSTRLHCTTIGQFSHIKHPIILSINCKNNLSAKGNIFLRNQYGTPRLTENKYAQYTLPVEHCMNMVARWRFFIASMIACRN